MRGSLILLILSVFVCVGCSSSSKVKRTGGKVTLVDSKPKADPFLIDRGQLLELLAQGPARFMQRVSVRPVVYDGVFYGFQLLSLFPQREARVPLPIRVGDIVQMINGMSVERPDQFMTIWSNLAQARQLSIRLVRDGEPLLVTWAIRDVQPVQPTSPESRTQALRALNVR